MLNYNYVDSHYIAHTRVTVLGLREWWGISDEASTVKRDQMMSDARCQITPHPPEGSRSK